MPEFLIARPITTLHTRRSPALGIRLNPDSTIEATNPPWLRSMEKRVNALLDLPENWDGYGAPRISYECIMAAFSLVLSNVVHETPAPEFVPTSLGGIQVEWHIAGYDLELMLDPGEPARYYHSAPSGIELEGDVAEDPSLVGSLFRDLPIRNDFTQPAR